MWVATLIALLLSGVARNDGACTPCALCEREGLMDQTARFVTDRSLCMPDDKVTNLVSFSKVYDLTCCPVRYHRAYYHKLVDCMVPSMTTLHEALKPDTGARVAIIPARLSEIYDVIFAGGPSVQRIAEDSRTAACYLLATNQSLVSNSGRTAPSAEARTAFYETMQRGLENLSHVDDGLLDFKQAPSSGATVTVLQRHGRGRAFANMEGIVAALRSAFPTFHVQVFHGNETAAQTMAVFSQSKVVVGYHGAGLANVLFSPPGTVVLEYTSLADVDSTALWRSNANLTRLHPNLTWIQHAVDIDRLDNGPTEAKAFADTVRLTRNHRHRNQLIKRAERVYVSPGALFNSISRLKKELSP